MKAYGRNKATQFTKKQISVVYGCAKRGELKVEKWIMSRLYDLAEYYGFDDNGSVEFEERFILAILDRVFDKNMDEAQERIDSYTEMVWNTLTAKYQQKQNRSLVA